MIVSDPQGGKVLVSAKGNITLLVEPERRPGFVLARIQRHYPVVAAMSLAAAIVSTILALYATYKLHDGLERRLSDRIEQIDDQLNAIMAGVETQSERQSTRLIQHVDRVGTRIDQVGQKVEQIGEHVDLLPATIDKAAQGSANSLISWLSALAPKSRQAAPALTVRGPDKLKR